MYVAHRNSNFRRFLQGSCPDLLEGYAIILELIWLRRNSGLLAIFLGKTLDRKNCNRLGNGWYGSSF